MILFANPYGFWTLFRRETSRFLKVYLQTVISPLLSNALFLGIFGGIFASRGNDVSGATYLQFLIPGLAIMGAITSAFQNPSSSLIIQKYQNTYQDLNTYPIGHLEKTLAFVLAGTLRGMIVALLTYLSAIPFVGARIADPLGFVASIALISTLFSSIGLIVGLTASSFDMVSFVQMIVLTPLTYFGGVFFRITQLPGLIASIARVNPVFPMVDLNRATFLGTAEGSIPLEWLITILLTAGTFLVAQWCMARGVGLRS